MYNNDTFESISTPKNVKQTWMIGIIFIGVALFLGVFLPLLMVRTPDESTKVADGYVVDYAEDTDDGDPIYAEIYNFQTPDGETHELTSDIWSSEPSYAINDRVQIYYTNENPDDAWVKDDKNLGIVIIVMQILGSIFGLIGVVVTALKMRNLDTSTINNIGGLIGALAFGIPSTLAFPILALINNGSTAASSTNGKLSEGDFFIGVIFTILGIVTTITAIFLFRSQQKNGSNGVFISFGK